MTPPKWEYGRKTAEGVPIWYVMVDESGHPYYDGFDSRPFTMGAILSGDPLDAYRVMQMFPEKTKSGKYREATGEIKHIRSSSTMDFQVMDKLEKQGFALFAVSVPYKKKTDQSAHVGSVLYLGTLSRLLIKIAQNGPDGIYRIRIDESEYLNEDMLYMCAEAAFSDIEGKSLAKHSPVRFYDSEFDPAIQLADSFVGQYRKAVSNDEGENFAKRHGIIVANRKKAQPMSGRLHVIQNRSAGFGRSRAWVIPYPSCRRNTTIHGSEDNIGPRDINTFLRGNNTKTKAKKTNKTARSRRK